MITAAALGIKIKNRSPFVFLDTTLSDPANCQSLFFSDFTDVLTFKRGDSPKMFFKKIQSYQKKGFYLAGYFTYEFGYCLEPVLEKLGSNNNQVLAWFGVCRKPKVFKENKTSSGDLNHKKKYSVKNIRANIKRIDYTKAIAKIKTYLEKGLSYQVNFTFKLKFSLSGDIPSFYFCLRESQPTAYSAFINTPDKRILSLSPELFFSIDKSNIMVKPMKGTIKRGVNAGEDAQAKKRLLASKKIKAENLMIVDLLRNDLGRICTKVKTSKLFEVEKYKTLFQMTSTVRGKLKKSLDLEDIFSSLFPCGSVTGAPKIKTMELIRSLEKEPRNIYTGAIGYFSPQGKSCFNVAIRTINLAKNKGELGIGGGIVYDSVKGDEYEEAMLKAKFFLNKNKKFSLIETILLDKGKYYLLDLHLKRLKASAEYFLIPFDLSKLKKSLKKLAILSKGKFKVRVLLSLDSKVSLKKDVLGKIKEPVKLKISSLKINPKEIFLYHKTTQRSLYDKELKAARAQGFFDLIFLNKEGELTEGAISNIFIKKKNKIYTPPLKSGLLPGVFRQDLLDKKRAEEKTLYLKDLKEADEIFIANSVRGLLKAKTLFRRK